LNAPAASILIAGGGTGGHLMPALAIATALRARHPDWRIVLVGAERGVEATLLPQRDFPFHLLGFEPIYRRQWWRNFRWPVIAARLLRAVGRLLDEERPDFVLGTGGYASGPVVWLAARRGIPTAVLEQDAFPGLATRWLAGRVREVYLGAPEAVRHLRPGRRTTVVVTGSPIAPPTPGRRPDALARFGLTGDRPVLLVTGGSQGSLAVNRLIEEWVASGGSRGLTLLWSTGRGGAAQFRRHHSPPDVQVFDFLDPIADAYSVADFAVCRAGMMTLAELCAWGIPSILIPLPTAAADHQRRNAAAMAAAGAALVLEQQGLTAAALDQTVHALALDRDRRLEMARQARQRGRPEAVREIVDRIDGLVAR
jgi:UDP-N-acetylglucosamine--N-acetylmuramyl-(pentapeptide) pyrophosphoryl-undecaprenol N-acetylglucosamine transferase